MSDPVQFHDLARKVLSGQSGEADRSALETLLRENPQWHREYAEMKEDWDVLREVAPLLKEASAGPGLIPPPPIERLRREVREVFARKQAERAGIGRVWKEVEDWAAGLVGPARQEALAALQVLRSVQRDIVMLHEGGPMMAYQADMRMMAMPRQGELLPTELEEAAARRQKAEEAARETARMRQREEYQRLRIRLKEMQERLTLAEQNAERYRAEMRALLAELDRLLAREAGR